MENLVETFVLPNLAGVKNKDLIEFEIKKELYAYTYKLLELFINHGYNDFHQAEIEAQRINENRPLKNLKILCVGESTLNRDQIFTIFNNAFSKQFGKSLPKKSLEMPVLEYKKMKSFDLVKKIRADRFDYIICGPKPHSTASKGINISLLNLKQKLNLRAIINDYNKDPLTKNALEELAETISRDYKQKQ